MSIPRENGLAFFPAEATAGDITLRPLTLQVAVRLAQLGIDIARPIPTDKIFVVAWVLAGEREKFARFTRRKVGLNALSTAVEKVLNDAFETYVAPLPEGSNTISLTPHGLGWPLEYAEFLCAEYGWPFETSIATPVCRAFALFAAFMQRNAIKHKGYDYIEREYAESLKRKK